MYMRDNAAMAVGPVIGYLHQIYVIRKSKSVGTFSIDICAILLFANILRINFYIFEKYELSLLFQSIIMILAQVIVLPLRSVWSTFAPNMPIMLIAYNLNLSLSPASAPKNLRICKTSGDGNFFPPIVLFLVSSLIHRLFLFHYF